MLKLGIFIGAYSYAIFVLGLLGQLRYLPVLITTIITIVLFFILNRKSIVLNYKNLLPILKINEFILIFLFIISASVNFIGVLGPELAFDALWYHLTIPKIFVESGHVFYINGGLFYYSLMPKLTEMLYVVSLIFANEIVAKVVHFAFGIFSAIVVYKISRLYVNRYFSLLGSLIFYSNLVVAWLSITAYIDLARTFYESLALFAFFLYVRNRKLAYFLGSAVFLGLAVSTKYLSLVSIFIFIVLILKTLNINFRTKLQLIIIYILIVLLICSPWLLVAYISSGNPFYPLFSVPISNGYDLSLFTINKVISSFLNFFLFSPDPINPIYLILLPFLIFQRKIFNKNNIGLLIYSGVALLCLYFSPQTGGGRFITAFLPAFSVLSTLTIASIKDVKTQRILIVMVIIVAIVTITYRFIANSRYIPFLVGVESKENFLMNNLSFSFGDFYDQRQEIKKIVGNEKVMVTGIHNLYYADFNFILPEWDSDKTKYILKRGSMLPIEYSHYKLVYRNKLTNVFLYKYE